MNARLTNGGPILEPVFAAVPTLLLYWDIRVGIRDRGLAFPSVFQPFGEENREVIETFGTTIRKR